MLNAMARSCTREEMAVELELSIPNLQLFYHLIFLKLGVDGRMDALSAAEKLSLLD